MQYMWHYELVWKAKKALGVDQGLVRCVHAYVCMWEGGRISQWVRSRKKKARIYCLQSSVERD